MQGIGFLINGPPALASADSLTGYIFRFLSGPHAQLADHVAVDELLREGLQDTALGGVDGGLVGKGLALRVGLASCCYEKAK